MLTMRRWHPVTYRPSFFRDVTIRVMGGPPKEEKSPIPKHLARFLKESFLAESTNPGSSDGTQQLSGTLGVRSKSPPEASSADPNQFVDCHSKLPLAPAPQQPSVCCIQSQVSRTAVEDAFSGL